MRRPVRELLEEIDRALDAIETTVAAHDCEHKEKKSIRQVAKEIKEKLPPKLERDWVEWL